MPKTKFEKTKPHVEVSYGYYRLAQMPQTPLYDAVMIGIAMLQIQSAKKEP